MSALSKYLDLVKQHPDLFRNTGEPGEIKIITDENQIRKEQRKIKTRLKKEGKPGSWIDIGVMSEDQWVWVVRDLVQFPDGRIGGYIRWINRKSQEGGFGSVLMCIQGEKVLMIRKYEHEGRKWYWEFPRGFGEPELTAEENALKEIEEEIGIKNPKLTKLTEVRSGKGGTAAFVVEIPENEEIILEKAESITNYRWVSYNELDEIIKQGKLSDWFSLWAYALFSFKRRRE
jgi:ADP-ribose pyrophosphatase